MSSIAIISGRLGAKKTPAVTDYNPNLILLMGQSNAEGRVPGANLPGDLTGALTGCNIYNNANTQWELLQYGVNNEQAQIPVGSVFGVEMRLMKLLYAQNSVSQYLFKYTEGGTGITPPSNAGTENWNIGAGSTQLFEKGLARWITAKALLSDKRPPKALIWIQGEADGAGTSYPTHLRSLIAQIRLSFNAPKMACIIVRLGNLQTSIASSGQTLVRANQQAVASDPNNYLVDADGCTCQGDNLHYDAGGFDTMAPRIVTTLNSF